MPGLLLKKSEWETKPKWNSFKGNKNELSQEEINARIGILEKRKPNLPSIVEEEINNALKQEFSKKNDYIYFMKKNKEKIKLIKDGIIKKHISETEERLKQLKSLLDN